MIVGFDHDDLAIFDRQFEFFEAANIVLPRLHMLQARPGTDTYDKLKAQQRVLDTALLHEPGTPFDNYLIPNIIPHGFTRIVWFERYLDLIERTMDWGAFKRRLRGYLEGVTYAPARRRPEGFDDARALAGLEGFVTSMDAALRDDVRAILAFTLDRAPLQLHNVVTLIVRYRLEAGNLPQIRETLREQIAFERELDLALCIERGRSCGGVASGAALDPALRLAVVGEAGVTAGA